MEINIENDKLNVYRNQIDLLVRNYITISANELNNLSSDLINNHNLKELDSIKELDSKLKSGIVTIKKMYKLRKKYPENLTKELGEAIKNYEESHCWSCYKFEGELKK